MSGSGVTERLLRRDRVLTIAMVGVLFALAGLYTVSGVGMRMSAVGMTSMRGMPAESAAGQWSAGYAALVFLMWWVMMIAMMLPSVSPTVLLYSALLRRGDRASRAPAVATAFLSGYLVAWALFSGLAASAQWGLEAAGYVSAGTMALTGTVPGALVLIAAGVFQFTPLKDACLRHCRSPAEFLVRRKRAGAGGAVVMGLEHGIHCLGCCWVLMALLFVGGIMNLYWIVGIAAYVALEKLTPWGEPLSKAGGVLLAGWGVSILIGAV